MRLAPEQVQPIGDQVAIRWNDGSESFLSMEFMRRACPCAGCGGEPDVLGRVVRPEVTHTPSSFRLKGFQLVGGYAIQPTWEDSHSTGLYTFPYLRRLAAAEAEGSAPV